ncbi:hypothetical protein TRAPUB_3090 [Trametes pubescens]|uniref:Uncharacterized protein n=1 Tax=Trametes pubescens TaxID=154538 RepID=A0A1M2VEM6_TRAPU|nr:hypothetical protein TRAPUB_3090 [Trametes pubescens]
MRAADTTSAGTGLLRAHPTTRTNDGCTQGFEHGIHTGPLPGWPEVIFNLPRGWQGLPLGSGDVKFMVQGVQQTPARCRADGRE